MSSEFDVSHLPHDSAGRIMTDKVPRVMESSSLADAKRLLQEHAKDFRTISYIYVVDMKESLKGVFSIKDVFRFSEDTLVKTVMKKNVVVAHPHTDQEQIAFLALKHSVINIPIIDKTGRFLGVILASKILQVLDTEATENILRFGGIVGGGQNFDSVFKLSIWKSIKHRIPWLLIGLLGGALAAGIVGKFESTLSQNLILAAFIPLITYMADAVGTQMEAFYIRDSAIDQKMKFVPYFLRQLMVVVLVGSIISVLAFGIVLLIYNQLALSMVLAIALFMAIMSSIFTGLLVPFFFERFKLDPANASGPIATIIQDLLSVLIYFLVATWLL